ncbi:PepSY domain-containing protein [Acidithiobacillus montserratensis]|uniref:PepSY domain-containing protein n=1 Tax=Acidithiobacillus montserratensis TaxID=2729135 RepID=A0ACD5HIV4_9PROT|nr:PepSY domain-containing protein [Acidithiobacillus montserratensis]MBN2679907.1 PepSY domain-containing protein [Acidithiobacillaceae bacterium]MBU2746719.1 PepSY domain-containing protein [Acidithiobacillus montserratensis]
MSVSKSLVAGILGGVLFLSAFGVYAFTGQKLAGEAKISIEQARVTALQVYPGKITDQELEKEKGGSGLRYSFVIRSGHVSHEVGIDARTGAVLENSLEGDHAD